MRKLTVLNWKENPSDSQEALRLFQRTLAVCPNRKEIIVAPPFVYLDRFSSVKNRRRSLVGLSAQNISSSESGAHTGEVSAKMIRGAGASYSIIGHSERRSRGESHKEIGEKITACLKNKITPILCVGEKRKSNPRRSFQFVKKQIKAEIEKANLNKIILAYEPVWAIGGNKKTDIKNSCRIIGLLKEYAGLARKGFAQTQVLYGGSVNCGNIADLLKCNNLDGFLIGSSSLKEKDLKFIAGKIYSNQPKNNK